MLGRDLISASLRLIGAIAPGEAPTAAEATDGLASINRMIDSWSNEGLLIFAITQESPLTLTPGTATYTLGSGGSITTRPQELERAAIRSGVTDYPVRLMSLDQYASISDKSTQSSIPSDLYDDGGYPQRTLALYPVPSAAYQLVLWTKRALSQIATLDTALSFPPGYEQALVFNGAIQLAPEYGRAVSQEVAAIAMEAKANASRANKQAHYLICDPSIVGRGRFNILTGDYSR